MSSVLTISLLFDLAIERQICWRCREEFDRDGCEIVKIDDARRSWVLVCPGCVTERDQVAKLEDGS